MNKFNIQLKNFYNGLSPTAHLSSLTSIGGSGHCSSMVNCSVLTPDYLTQGEGLSNLTYGTQAGAVTELINFIMDKAVSDDKTFGISATKLFEISSTEVTNTGDFPYTITGATDGESCVYLRGNLYYFYNKASGGDCGKYDLSATFDDDWISTVPTGAAALQSAPHPVATKEDTMCFGNGRYLGVYIDSTTTVYPNKLDFGNGHEVADVVFHANQYWIAVNGGVSGTNRTTGQIFLYDGSATSSILDDETSVGVLRIGFLYVLNGIVYVAYQDLSSSSGYKIGYISGRRIIPLVYFSGSLPTYKQKTLYKGTILFISNNAIYSAGSVIEDLPFQISQIADGGYSTVGAIAAPFGTPMVASTDNTNYRLARFVGYDTNSSWRSLIISITNGRNIGMIDTITVLTNTLGSGARCDLQLEYNQNTSNSGTPKQITGIGKRRFVFTNFGSAAEDFRVFLDWSNGSQTNPVRIRQIDIEGHYIER